MCHVFSKETLTQKKKRERGKKSCHTLATLKTCHMLCLCARTLFNPFSCLDKVLENF